MAGRHISVDEAHALAAEILERAGLTAEESAAVADIVVWTELTGYPQIGLARLPRMAEYVRRVDREPIRVERDGPFSAHLEAGRALGYVTALRMVEVVEAKVRATGVGMVTANGSGLTGRNAYYVERLAEQGWVAFMVNNFPAVVAPHGSSEALFGTNPLSVAMPTTGAPLVVDISAATLIDADLRFHRLEGRPLPEGLAFDAEGNATTDAAAAIGGAVKAFGEHRGSALALAIQAFGVLAGSPPVPSQPDDSGVFLMALQPSLFGDPDDIAERLTELLQRVRGARPADPAVPVRAPNDRALASMEAIRERGIDVSDELSDALDALRWPTPSSTSSSTGCASLDLHRRRRPRRPRARRRVGRRRACAPRAASAELVTIDGGNPLVVGELRASTGDDAPTVLIYGHYDVQGAGAARPPGPRPPFEPEIRDGRIYARGAADDKGNFLPLLHVACELAERRRAAGQRARRSSRARRRPAARRRRVAARRRARRRRGDRLRLRHGRRRDARDHRRPARHRDADLRRPRRPSATCTPACTAAAR